MKVIGCCWLKVVSYADRSWVKVPSLCFENGCSALAYFTQSFDFTCAFRYFVVSREKNKDTTNKFSIVVVTNRFDFQP